MKLTQLAAVIASLSLAMTSFSSFAQTEVDADFQDAPVQDSIKSGSNGGIIILNSNSNKNNNESEASASGDAAATTTATAASEAATSSESVSAADAMKKARESAEVSTEQRIVEKLEASRLEDERRRADALFGDRFEAMNKKEVIETDNKIETSKQIEGDGNVIVEKNVVVNKVEKEEVKTVAPVVVEEAEVVAPIVAPAPIVVQEQTAVITPPAALTPTTVYAGLTLGGMSYDASNVESKYAIGGVIGKDLGNGWLIEGSILYSKHFVDTFWKTDIYSEVEQYDFGFTTKYAFGFGSFKPYVGAGAAYIYRNYTDRVISYSGSQYWQNDGYNDYTGDANTHAVDGSLLAGLDIEVSKSFLIGAEYKYSMNVFVNNDEPVFAKSWAQPTFGKPLEEIDRSMVTVSAKYLF